MKYDSLAVGIPEATPLRLALYPDPAVTTLTVDFAMADPATYEITDIRGKTMTTGNAFGNRFTIDVAAFPPGIYFLRLKTVNSTFTGKFCRK